MELIQGENLARRIRKNTIHEREALGYIYSTLEAASYIQAQSIVHRDLKPSNLMFQRNRGTKHSSEVLKVIDFGLCADLSDRSSESLVHDKCGTVGYLAPELIAKKSKKDFYDGKVDVFSIGVILYET